MTITDQPLTFVVERVAQDTGFCPGCQEHVPVMFADELYPHATPAAEPCLGDKWSRCESRHRQLGYRCQLAPHESGKHRRQPSRSSGLASWDDEPIQPKHPHPNGGSCWTHSMCEAREALDKLTQHMERHHADTRTEWAPLVERLAEAVVDPFS